MLPRARGMRVASAVILAEGMAAEAAKRGDLGIATQPDYCGRPSTVKARTVPSLSRWGMSSLRAAELTHACTCSALSHWIIATRGLGGAPSIPVTFCPAARTRPPAALITAWAFGA